MSGRMEMQMGAIQRLRFRLYAAAIRFVRRAHARGGWYAAANVVMGYVSLGFGLVCLWWWYWTA